MPKVSVIILTKDRAELLKKALASVSDQSFKDVETVVVNDGSTDGTEEQLKDLKIENLKIISHLQSQGITQSRQEALEASIGEYVAILDDDDEWIDAQKLKKQVDFLDNHPDCVLVGGGMVIERLKDLKIERFRPSSDSAIRSTMLFRNNFFTSTVMFRREAAIKAGGFVKDEIDLAEDYDLWLRLGKIGKMGNIHSVFTDYHKPLYNKEKFRLFLKKQLKLVEKHKEDYSWAFLAKLILKLRIFCGK